MDASGIQSIEIPPWDRPANAETEAWSDALRAKASTLYKGDLVKAAGASTSKGMEELQALNLVSASRSFSEAAVLDPLSPYPYLGYVDIYRIMGKTNEMQFCLQEAIERSTKQRAALILIGTNYSIDGEYQKAIGFFNAVLELDANDKGAHLLLSKAYRHLNDHQRAEHHEKLAGK
jgi:tetratricopeptide (TPR) repeat protein